MLVRSTYTLCTRKYLAELGYPAPRTVSKLVDQVRSLDIRAAFTLTCH